MSRLHHFLVPHESNNQRARLLHPSILSVIIGCFALFQLILSGFSSKYPYILGYASQIPPEEIVRLSNIERQSKGLGALTIDSQLTQAALRKAADMFTRDYWAHVSPAGTQPWYFITDAGYAYRYAGENLARDFSDSASVVKAWMDSPTHRDNLLSARYQNIGVAVVDGKLNGQETTLVVQMFGTRLAAAPAVGGGNSLAVKAAPLPSPVITSIPTATPLPVQVAAVREQPPVKSHPITSPFQITQYLSLSLLVFFIGLLAVDVWITHSRRITRWTSKSLAHVMFLAIILLSAALVLRGQIL